VSTEQRKSKPPSPASRRNAPHLGDALVDAALAPLRRRLDALNAARAARPDAQALRQVSVLFLDVVGSTTLSRGLDPKTSTR
jgi:class 3 adenylate cyclase